MTTLASTRPTLNAEGRGPPARDIGAASAGPAGASIIEIDSPPNGFRAGSLPPFGLSVMRPSSARYLTPRGVYEIVPRDHISDLKRQKHDLPTEIVIGGSVVAHAQETLMWAGIGG